MGVTRVRHYLWPQGIVIAVILVMLSTVAWTGIGKHTVAAYPAQPSQLQAPSVINLAKFTPLVQYALDCAVEKCVALTFDDGPDGTNTNDILHELRQLNAQATFFVLGSRVAAHPESLKQMLADGHDIGNHSWDHKDFLRLNAADIEKQINQTNEAISSVVGITPIMFRPPYGDTNAEVRKSIPLPIVTWNVDPKDWSTDNPDQLMHNAVDHTNPGAVVVLHSTHPATVKALPSIVEGLRAKGYALVPVSKLVQFTPADNSKIFIGR